MLDIRPEIATALREGQPVVALESTLIAHGLPWPINLETARAAEAAIREEGAIPATIAALQGRPTIGLRAAELEALAQSADVLKASSRDLAAAVVQGRTAATTVAGTMRLAHLAGIRVFATGGIGGAHRNVVRGAWRVAREDDRQETTDNGQRTTDQWDVSADLWELARTPVLVVCAGAKSILDIPRTLEILETLGVPVIGFGTDEFPAFYVRSSGEKTSARVETPEEAAALAAAHWQLGGAGLVLAQPLAEVTALTSEEFETALRQAEDMAAATNIRGPALTPFLLARLAEITQGKTLRANQELVVANARLAARVVGSGQ